MKNQAAPAKDRMLLMRAAVLDAPQALESWQQWLRSVDLEAEHLDPVSFQALPLVYHNLSGQQIDHPSMARLKGIYRRAWLEKQLRLRQVSQLIAALDDAGIPILLLDDLTSSLRPDGGRNLRPLFSLDMLVRPQDVAEVLGTLSGLHVWPKVDYGDRFLSVETPLEFWPAFDLPLTLAWRVLPAITTCAQALAAWEHRESAVLGGRQVFALDPESHFVRACLRVVASGPEPAWFALLDVALMLRRRANAIDWQRVVDLATLNRLTVPVAEVLHQVGQISESPRATEILALLRVVEPTWTDRLDAMLIYRYQPRPGLIQRLLRRLLLYRRSPKVAGLFGFARYMQYVWGAPGLRTMPRFAARRLANAFSGSARSGVRRR